MIIKINLIQIFVITAFKLIFSIATSYYLHIFFSNFALILLLDHHKFNNHHKMNNYYQYKFKIFFFVISLLDYVTVNFYYS